MRFTQRRRGFERVLVARRGFGQPVSGRPPRGRLAIGNGPATRPLASEAKNPNPGTDPTHGSASTVTPVLKRLCAAPNPEQATP